MKAMILAAGRGKRLRPLTDSLPKALIEVHGAPLIEHHIKRLVESGIDDIIINLAHLGDKIKSQLKDGAQFGASITYSEEPNDAYETGGGIVNALPLLGPSPFVVINSDIYCPFDFKQLPTIDDQLGHLILIQNPKHNLKGDYSLVGDTLSVSQGKNPYTYSGIALYHPRLFKDCAISRYSVTPLIQEAAVKQKITGECYDGPWHDVGTMDRLLLARKPLP
jgi:MurNAc alpha-1-phosphate uridylyltransferase